MENKDNGRITVSIKSLPPVATGQWVEWLPEGYLVYFISDVVEVLDLSAFYARYDGSGRRNSL